MLPQSVTEKKAIRVGTNLLILRQAMNNAMTTNLNFYGCWHFTVITEPIYFGASIFLFLNPVQNLWDGFFLLKGLKCHYAHPLKGRYIKLDKAVSY